MYMQEDTHTYQQYKKIESALLRTPVVVQHAVKAIVQQTLRICFVLLSAWRHGRFLVVMQALLVTAVLPGIDSLR